MDINKMLREASKMQQKMQEEQAALEKKEFSIVSAGGAVSLTITGAYVIKDLKIDKDILNADDAEMLEDTLTIAFNEAIKTIQKETEKITSSVTSGMNIPGF